MTQLLTPDEIETMDLLADVANHFGRIVGDGDARHADLTEAVHHIHILQRMVLAQTAGRAFPHDYRLLGERIQ